MHYHTLLYKTLGYVVFFCISLYYSTIPDCMLSNVSLSLVKSQYVLKHNVKLGFDSKQYNMLQ